MWLRANDTTPPEDLGFKKFLPTYILVDVANLKELFRSCAPGLTVTALYQNLYGVLPNTRGPLCGAMLTVLSRVYVRPP